VFFHGYLVGPWVNLAGADLAGANLSQADLTRVSSGAVVGTPSSLPPGWVLAEFVMFLQVFGSVTYCCWTSLFLRSR
jgi:hypothetical protein